MKVPLNSRTLLWLELKRAGIPAASAWEITVKWMAGKLKLPVAPANFLAESRRRGQILSLPIEEGALAHLPKLPRLHTDPFDRMLICQAIEHSMTIATPDETIQQYAVRTIWG